MNENEKILDDMAFLQLLGTITLLTLPSTAQRYITLYTIRSTIRSPVGGR